MDIKVKKINEKAVLPTKAHTTDAGLDLVCTEITTEVGEDAVVSLVYHTGITIEIPDGFVGLLFNRSSVASKSLTLTNAVGVIDSGYRGEIMAKFKINTLSVPSVFKPGEAFAQLIIMPYPEINLIEIQSELNSTERGDSGYGSSNDTTNTTTQESGQVSTEQV